MLSFKHIGKFTAGFGTVYTINLADNNVSPIRSDFKKLLLGKMVEIDGRMWVVKGIEAFAIPEDCHHKDIGLLVKDPDQ